MSEVLAYFKQRATRYVLNTQDLSLIRYAGPRSEPWEEGTQIQDISTSGLSFTTPESLTPQIGERIRVQFHVPGSIEMACYGRVVRLEEHRRGDTLVAIRFEELTAAHRIVLSQGLRRRLKLLRKRKRIEKALRILLFPLALIVHLVLRFRRHS